MRYLLLLALTFPNVLLAQNAMEVLKKSSAYHDPNGEWKNLDATFVFKETRPDGADRKSILILNNRVNSHVINRNEEEIYEVNAAGEVSIVKGEGTTDRGKMLRNYYVFLWGLPMKLLDRGTPISPDLSSRDIKGEPCFGVEVAYTKETYTFFFDKKTYRMMAYQFYKNDDSGIGEMIHLEGEVVFNGMRIPKERAWHVLPGNKYLGTDILESAK